jgi:hypothetical protein
MTVAELIEYLKTVPNKDAVVVYWNAENECYFKVWKFKEETAVHVCGLGLDYYLKPIQGYPGASDILNLSSL